MIKMAYSQPRKLREPERKSILQVVQASFSYFDRNTFIHRFIYIGEVPARDGTMDSSKIIEDFDQSIKPINDRYCDEAISGFLLYFGNYFCHVLETSEESFVRHLRRLKENENLKECFDKFKIVMIYHHMNQRFIEEWVPICIEETNQLRVILTDETVNFEGMKLKIKCLIEKVYVIGNSLKVKVVLRTKKLLLLFSLQGIVTANSQQATEESKAKMRASRYRFGMKTTKSHVKIAIGANLLPEREDIRFLANCLWTKPLRTYLDVYNNVPYMSCLGDSWPIQTDRIPKHIFEEKTNQVGDLPTYTID